MDFSALLHFSFGLEQGKGKKEKIITSMCNEDRLGRQGLSHGECEYYKHALHFIIMLLSFLMMKMIIFFFVLSVFLCIRVV